MAARSPLSASPAPFVVVAVVVMNVLGGAAAVQAQGLDQPRSLTASVFGSRVSFFWQAPLNTSQPLVGYQIEAGPGPGSIAVVLPVGNRLNYSVTAPNGVYFVRVRALLASGAGALPSNEVMVTVAVPPPLPPAGPIATVVRLSLSLRWQQAEGSAPVTGWILEAGSAPGLSDLARLPLPALPRSFSATVPAGTYFLRIRAVNAAGPSPPSAELEVTTGPDVCTVPFAPTGIRSLSGQGGVLINWDAPAGPLPSGYWLAAGTSPGVANLGVFPLPPSTVFSTLAPANTYYVRLAAANVCGDSPLSDEVSFTVLPASPFSLVGTWSGTLTGYSKPYPWTPITSFQLTLNTAPTSFPSRLSGLWTDNRGCRHTLIAGGIQGLPFFSMESLACNDGDLVFTVLSNNGLVVEGVCSEGPDCRFRMTRR